MEKTNSQIMKEIAVLYSRRYGKEYKARVVQESLEVLEMYEARLDSMARTIRKQKEVLENILKDKALRENELEAVLEIHIYD